MKTKITIPPIKCQTIEVNVSLHCNLSCRGCTHLSPLFDTLNLTRAELEKDLKLLRPILRAEYLTLLGGEPLLNPDLVGIISTIKNSGITEHVKIYTNGLLLPKTSEEVWKSLDSIRISSYSGSSLKEADLNECLRKAEKYQISLEIDEYQNFREGYSEIGTKDPDLVERIYNTCQITHQTKCYTLFYGTFFKCPQTVFIELNKRRLINRNFHKLDEISFVDGYKLRADLPAEEQKQRLLSYLNNRSPLENCSYCLGCVGKLFPHSKRKRHNWREPQMLPTEELLDYEHLNKLEINPDEKNYCLKGHNAK